MVDNESGRQTSVGSTKKKKKKIRNSNINKAWDRGYGKAQRGSCHGQLSGQAALLELCYLSAAASRPAEGGVVGGGGDGRHCSEAGHILWGRFSYRACVFGGQSHLKSLFIHTLSDWSFQLIFSHFNIPLCLISFALDPAFNHSVLLASLSVSSAIQWGFYVKQLPGLGYSSKSLYSSIDYETVYAFKYLLYVKADNCSLRLDANQH